MIRCLTLLVFSLAGRWLVAQEPVFRVHDIGDFNAGVSIHTLLQDHQSMIWLGTDSGLARYDGSECHEVSFTDTTQTFQVRTLFEDSRDHIWVGTSSGRIFVLDETREMSEFIVEEGSPAVPITAIREDAMGYVWIATYGEGVYVYTGSRLFNMDLDDGLSGVDVYAMDFLPGSGIWAGTDNGISICSFEGEQKSIKNMGLNDGLPDQIVTALKVDPLGQVWIGTFEFGVVCYTVSGEMESVLPDAGLDEITALTIFDQDEVWIGTRTQGVWRCGSKADYPQRMNGLNQSRQGQVNDLLTDVEGNIWVAMEGGRLMSGFRPFESLKVNIPEIQSVFCDASESLWIGTRKGLYLLRQGSEASASPIRLHSDLDLNITSMVEDDYDQIWIGTLDQGLFVYNRTNGHIQHFGSIVGDGGITIMSMAASASRIWLATLEGVVSYPRDKNITTSAKRYFSLLDDPWQSNLHFVFQVFVDRQDRIWFASDGNGVFQIDGDRATQFIGDSSLHIKTVYSVCQDNEDHIWFNTPDHGLVEFDGEHYTPFGFQDGLHSQSIAGINLLGSGDLLITGEDGFTLMQPASRHTMYFGEEIGVREFEPGLNANATSKQGHAYSSGANVIYKYYSPNQTFSIHPRTQLTAVKVFDKPINFFAEDRFSHGQNYITFQYVGLWYTSPSSVRYLYKLEGYDRQWKESKDNEANYSNLAPGDYTFSVKASENSSFLNEPMATYSFTITRPFWTKLWFVALVMMLGAGLFYWFLKSRERKSARQALLRKDMIESQLTALKAQINPHFLFNSFNTLITIIDENPMHPDLAVKYVEKLSDFYRSILQYREHETISSDEEWELVKNYVYLLRERYGDNLHLHMDDPPKEARVIPLTLQMLVENAVKHNIITEQSPLHLYIMVDGQYILVKNSRKPKAHPEPSTQFGLNTISSRYQHLSQHKVVVEKTDDVFVVKIPMIKKSNHEGVNY